MRRWLRSSVAMSAALAVALSMGVSSPVRADDGATPNPEITGQEWTTPTAVKVGQVPERAVLIPFDTVEQAKAAPTTLLAQQHSPNVRMLNGTWKFNYVDKPSDKPDLAGVTSIPTGYQDIPVPSSWQVANQYAGALGTDLPIYNNQDYAFQAAGNGVPNQGDFEASRAPTVFNPVGTYMRELEISAADLDGNRLILSFLGVEAGFYLYVNGAVVGYGEDSFSTSEFDVTDYLHEGTNTIAAQVYRWTTGSFIENQDGLNFSGIHRDVYLTVQPEVAIYDYNVETLFQDHDYSSSELELTLDIANVGGDPAQRSVRARLYDQGGAQFGGTLTGTVSVPARGNADAVLRGDFVAPALWSAEFPNLYTLVAELVDGDGVTTQTISRRVGFREFYMDNAGTSDSTSNMRINGQNIEFYGTNRGQSHPTGGRYVPYTDIVKDVENMKRLNINSMRSSHYPPEPHLVELADEYGIYLMDEVNNESHNGRDGINIGSHKIDPSLSGRYFPGNDSRYTDALVQRTRSMVMRDKNNASVIMYSLGNEAGSGPNFDSMIDVIKELDGEELIHYQGDNGNPRVDMIGNFYPAYDRTDNATREKPGLLSEYQHAMGNTGGAMELYVDVFEARPRQQGGFIWEYNDHSVYTLKPGVDPAEGVSPGDLYLGINGSWQQHSDDGNFLADGFIYPDRSWKPMAYEIRAHYQDLKFLQSEAQQGTNEVTMRNLNRFKNANYYTIRWSLLEDGEPVQTGVLTDADADLAPATGDIVNGSEKSVEIPYTLISPTPGAEYRVRIDYTLKSDTVYAGAGYVQGSGEFAALERGADVVADLSASEAATVADTPDSVVVSGTTPGDEPFSVGLDKATGKLTNYTVGGRELITKAPTGSFFRPETDQNTAVNGRAWIGRGGMDGRATDGGSPEIYHPWIRQGEHLNDVVVQVLPGDDGVTSIRVSSKLDNGSSYATTYAIFDDGTVKVEATLTPSDSAPDQLGEYGMLMQLPGDYENLQWYGRGPGESYWDRKTDDRIGRWESTVTDRFFPYIRIQETGNATDVRWLALTDDDGNGVLATMDFGEGYSGTPLEAVALHYTPESLSSYDTDHFFPHEAQRTDDVVLRLLTHQKGIGNTTWGAEPPYAVVTKRSTDLLTINYALQPLTAGDLPAEKARTIYPDAEAPLLKSVEVDGIPLEGFDPLDFNQSFVFPPYYPEGLAPVVTATGPEGLPISITQPESVPGSALIRVGEPGAQLTYTIDLSYSPPVGPVVSVPDLVEVPSSVSASGAITVGDPGVGNLLYAYSGYSRIFEDRNPAGIALETVRNTVFERGFGGNSQQIIDLDISDQDPATFSATTGIDIAKAGQSRASVNFQVWAHKDVSTLTRQYYAPMNPGVAGAGTTVKDGWVLLEESGVMTRTSADYVFAQVPLTYQDAAGKTQAYQALRLVMEAHNGDNGHDQAIWGDPVITRAVPEDPQLRSITMDGGQLPGFAADGHEYTVVLGSGAHLPNVGVTADAGLFTWVTQATSVPGTATVRVGEATYRIDFERAAGPTQLLTGLTGFVTVPEGVTGPGTHRFSSLHGNLLHVYSADGPVNVDRDATGARLSLRVDGEGDSAEVRQYEHGFSGVARQLMDFDISGGDALRFTAEVGLDWGAHPDSEAPQGDGAAVEFEVWAAEQADVLDNGYYAQLDSLADDATLMAGWTRLGSSPIMSNHAYQGSAEVQEELYRFDLDLTHLDDDGQSRAYEAVRLIVKPVGSGQAATGVWGDPAVTFTGADLNEPVDMIRLSSSVDGGVASISYLFDTLDTGGQIRVLAVAYDDDSGRLIGQQSSLINTADGNQDGDLRIPLAEGTTPARLELLLVDPLTLSPVAGAWIKDPADGDASFRHTPLREVVDVRSPAFEVAHQGESGLVSLSGSGFAPGSVLVVEVTASDVDGLDHVAFVRVDGTGSLEYSFPSGAGSIDDLAVRIGGQGLDEILAFPEVQTIPVVSVEVSGDGVVDGAVSVTIGESLALAATVLPENATQRSVAWVSSDPEVVEVDPTGRVSARSVGTASVTANAVDGSGVSGTVLVTVKVAPSPEPSASPSPSPSTPSATPSGKPTPTPGWQPSAPYTVAGVHRVNGRQWSTTCEKYSQTVRCRTDIWATSVVKTAAGFQVRQGWAFNNLTYLPYMTRAQWAANPLGFEGTWTAPGSREWRTECDTAATGRGACRSYTLATVYAAKAKPGGGYTYSQSSQWVFNNIVMFRQ